METPLKLTYQGIDGTPLLDQLIEGHVARIEQYHNGIAGVDVTIELQQKELRHGSRYRVIVHVLAGSAEPLVVDYQPAEKEAAVPLQTAIQRAFTQVFEQIDSLVAPSG